ncbi:MAG: peptidoglycan DD-metalloendopeptidase family protein [Calditrichaeota bacterium]|nr:peptidoglycan DD-metalloendopeptidase family protein [Calditrichota bacterium]
MSELIKSVLNFLFSNSLFSAFAFLLVWPVAKFWLKKDFKAQAVLFFLIIVRLFFPIGQIFSFNPVSYVSSDLNINLQIFNEPHFNGPLNPGLRSSGTLDNNYIIFFAWLAGSMAFLTLILYKRYYYHSLQKKTTPVLSPEIMKYVEDLKNKYRISRKIKLLVSKTQTPPFTFGVIKPVIILPGHLQYNNLSDEIRTVLAHEMVHIKNYDAIRIFLLGMIQAVYFFNPVVWIIIQRLNFIREIRCDHFVVKNKIIQPAVMGKVLLGLSSHSKKLPLTFILALTGFKNNLKNRLLALKGENHMSVNKYIFSFSVLAFTTILLSMSQPLPAIMQETATAVSAEEFAKPLDEIKVTSGYGMRKHPVLKKMMKHQGVDFSAEKGTPVFNIAEGKVIEAEKKGNYGNTVVIQHADNIRSLYAQLSEILVQKNQIIKKGEVIGKVGNSGLSTAPHLHFEIRKNNQSVDPADYLDLKNQK